MSTHANVRTVNRLVNNYQAQQGKNAQFNNNSLLKNTVKANNTVMVRQAFRNADNIRKFDNNDRKEKNTPEKNNLDKIRDAIMPKQKPDKATKRELDAKLMETDVQYKEKKINELQSTRTNVPYKTITNDQKFVGRQKIEKKELIMHIVTPQDKVGVEGELKTFEGSLEKHNNELKVVYSTSKENEHRQKFDYVHKQKYRIPYSTSSTADHDKMKVDTINYFKNEQKKLEEGKENVDNVMESLIATGVVTGMDLDSSTVENKESSESQNIEDSSDQQPAATTKTEKVSEETIKQQEYKPRRIVIAPERTNKTTSRTPVASVPNVKQKYLEKRK